MRLPFLRSKDDPATERARVSLAAGDTTLVGDAAVQAARKRARQRLLGALVLLVAGVIGFPLLFETDPRPLPADVPMGVTREGLSADAGSAGRVSGRTTEATTLEPAAPAAPLDTAPAQVVAAAPSGPASTSAAVPVVAAPVAPAPSAIAEAQPLAPPPAVPAPAKPPADAAEKPPAKPPAQAPTAADPAARPVAAAAKPATAAPATPAAAAVPDGAGRYVVQAGAYADPASLRTARQKVEKLGLKTYTQVIESGGAKRTRVRVGPYATRQEAEAAAARIKATGLAVSVLTL